MAMDYHQIRILLEEMTDDGFLQDTLIYEPENGATNPAMPWFSQIALTQLVQAAENAVAFYEHTGDGDLDMPETWVNSAPDTK